MKDPKALAALEILKEAGFAWSLFHKGWGHLEKRMVIIRASWYNNLPEAWVYLEFPVDKPVEVMDFATFESAAMYAMQRYEEVDDVGDQSIGPR